MYYVMFRSVLPVKQFISVICYESFSNKYVLSVISLLIAERVTGS